MPGKRKVTRDRVIVFFRRFPTMIDAGLPVIQCLQILCSQEDDPEFRTVLQDMLSSVEGNATLAQALRKHPKLFDDPSVSLVEAGEAGGILETTMRRVSAYLEKNALLGSQMKAAVAYPIAMAAAAVFATYVAVNLSQFLVNHIFYVLGALVISIFAFRVAWKTAKGREVWDEWVLKSPIFGALLLKSSVASFTRTMATMLASGVGILDALTISGKGASNMAIEKAISAVRSGIAAGGSMADGLADSRIIPKMVCQLVATGEATGALDSMLSKIADYYDAEIDLAVENLRLLMLLSGIVLGGLVFGMAAFHLKVIGA